MTVKKIIAIGLIFLATFIAWMVLGVSNMIRSEETVTDLRGKTANLYGDMQQIEHPKFIYRTKEIYEEKNEKGEMVEKVRYVDEDIKIDKSDVSVDIQLDQRKKGLIWYPTYKVGFDSEYVVENINTDKNVLLYVALGDANAIYNNISLSINGKTKEDIAPLYKKHYFEVKPDAKGKIFLKLSYDTTGMEQWRYMLSPGYNEIQSIEQFKLSIDTDFDNYDYPGDGFMSAQEVKDKGDGKGKKLIWTFEETITGKDIGVVIPNRLNAAEITPRVTFFAPVPLLFFFFVMIVLSVLMKVDIHPMHFFFLAAAFFSFHLMFSYFSDHMNIYMSFGIASLVSLLLNASYLRFIAPPKIITAALFAQFIYLVAFSYSFFLKGITGLVLTIVSVLTLFVLMQLTGKVNWDEAFAKKDKDEKAK